MLVFMEKGVRFPDNHQDISNIEDVSKKPQFGVKVNKHM